MAERLACISKELLRSPVVPLASGQFGVFEKDGTSLLIDKDETILSQGNLVPISKLVSNSHGKFAPIDEYSSMAVLIKEIVLATLFSQHCMVGRD
jgi:hypothetical protein